MLMAQTAADRIDHLGEVALIEQIGAWLGPVNPPAPAGIGDDCAVLDPPLGAKQIITTDTVSYGQHFDDRVSAEDAGAKLIKRNLSDIAAMGGMPGPAVLALLCGPDVSILWLKDFFNGIRRECQRHQVPLVGGDVSALQAGNFSAVLTLTGSAATPKLRHRAQLGDHIYVTGTLGGSILQKHYAFAPRLREGQWLAAHPSCHAMMDLTDGLGKDLQSMLHADYSAALDLAAIPIAEAAQLCAQTSGRSVLDHAFCDGEDYELLFTVDGGEHLKAFEAHWAKDFPKVELSCIGRIQAATPAGRLIDAGTNTALPWTHGFEHLTPV
jgi:thiamine-monophosphate kinase